MHNQKTLVAALAYAAHGWAVFPVPPGTKRSYKSAEYSDGRAWGMTREAAEIRADFTRWPDAGIGIPCGAVNGIIVVETDTVEGHGIDGSNSLAQLETKHGALPETLEAISPSGSVHRYFKHPGAGTRIKSSASELGAGIDVKGDGGMIIAPPTARPGVGVYRWINLNPIAVMPDWLIELTKGKQPPKPKRLSIRERAQAAVRRWQADRLRALPSYGAAALQYEIGDLAKTAEGSRNHALNRSAFNLFQLVHDGQLDRSDVERHLIDACAANGLIEDRAGRRAIEATIRSAFKGAAAKPRRRLT